MQVDRWNIWFLCLELALTLIIKLKPSCKRKVNVRLTWQNSEQEDVIRECDKAWTSKFVEYAILIEGKFQFHVDILLG